MSLLHKLDQLTARYAELQASLSGGNLDSQKFVAASKEYSDLGPLVEAIGEWRKAEQELKEAEALAADPDVAEVGGDVVEVRGRLDFLQIPLELAQRHVVFGAVAEVEQSMARIGAR